MGLSACKTAGLSAICVAPKMPSTLNHNNITGPKKAPTTAVPLLCTQNKLKITKIEMGKI